MKMGNSTKIGICWAAIVATGIYAFYLSKESIIDKRYENMKIRQRMYASNIEEDKPDRY